MFSNYRTMRLALACLLIVMVTGYATYQRFKVKRVQVQADKAIEFCGKGNVQTVTTSQFTCFVN